MKEVFADTFYFLAVHNPADEAHERALAFSRHSKSFMVTTTAWVLTEFADALADPANRGECMSLLADLNLNPKVTIVPPTQALFEAGLALYEKRPDKAWSLTDCISFVVMEERKITEALTGDHHFGQAGFKAILAEDDSIP